MVAAPAVKLNSLGKAPTKEDMSISGSERLMSARDGTEGSSGIAGSHEPLALGSGSTEVPSPEDSCCTEAAVCESLALGSGSTEVPSPEDSCCTESLALGSGSEAGSPEAVCEAHATHLVSALLQYRALPAT